jgi:hypothetical protein
MNPETPDADRAEQLAEVTPPEQEEAVLDDDRIVSVDEEDGV